MPESQTRPLGPYNTLMLGIDDNGPENSTASGHFLPILLTLPQKNLARSRFNPADRGHRPCPQSTCMVRDATRCTAQRSQRCLTGHPRFTSRYLPNGATRQTGMCTRAGVRGSRGDPPLPGKLKAHTGQAMETGWKPGSLRGSTDEAIR